MKTCKNAAASFANVPLKALEIFYVVHEREKSFRQSSQHFARTMLDLLWSPRLTPEISPATSK